MKSRNAVLLPSLAIGICALCALPAQATLIIGFQFAVGGTSVTVPESGGSYLVNVIASTDNAAVTNMGWQIGWWGALSSVLNANLGNGTLDGDITAQSMPAIFSSVGGTNGDITNITVDGRDDLGPAANTTVNSRGLNGSHPWWVVPGGGPGPQNGLGSFASPILLGSFTVTIPAYTGNGNSGAFLRYVPNLQASISLPIIPYDLWTENGTSMGGKFAVAPGTTTVIVGGTPHTFINVNIGTSVTFEAVPEPGTFLLGAIGLGLFSLIGVRATRRAA